MRKKPVKFMILKEGLRIDFTDQKGKNLGYLRFEHTNCEDNVPTYLGSIDKKEKLKLKKLKSAIDVLLKESK